MYLAYGRNVQPEGFSADSRDPVRNVKAQIVECTDHLIQRIDDAVHHRLYTAEDCVDDSFHRTPDAIPYGAGL